MYTHPCACTHPSLCQCVCATAHACLDTCINIHLYMYGMCKCMCARSLYTVVHAFMDSCMQAPVRACGSVLMMECIHVCMYASARMRLCEYLVYARVHVCVCVHACMRACRCAGVCTCVRVCMRSCGFKCVSEWGAHICSQMRAYVCRCKHAHMCIRSFPCWCAGIPLFQRTCL